MDSSKIQQSQIGKVTETSGTSESQQTGISALRIQDMMAAAIFADRAKGRTTDTEGLKGLLAQYTNIKDNLNGQIDALKNIADKM